MSAGAEDPAPARRPRHLRLVPLGPEPPTPRLVDWLAAELASVLGVPAVVEPVLHGDDAWLTPQRSQLRSGWIVETLLEYYPPARVGEPEDWVVGVTSADLRAGGREFVFGEAAVGGGWAVVSTARLGAAGEPAFRARLVKEALHELGHLAGLPHCDRADCLMHPAATVADVDARGAELCEGCRRARGREGALDSDFSSR